jgi:hypothetical protein
LTLLIINSSSNLWHFFVLEENKAICKGCSYILSKYQLKLLWRHLILHLGEEKVEELKEKTLNKNKV